MGFLKKIFAKQEVKTQNETKPKNEERVENQEKIQATDVYKRQIVHRIVVAVVSRECL